MVCQDWWLLQYLKYNTSAILIAYFGCSNAHHFLIPTIFYSADYHPLAISSSIEVISCLPNQFMHEICSQVWATVYKLSAASHEIACQDRSKLGKIHISQMYFCHWKPSGVSERMWSVNLDASISGEYQTFGGHSCRPSE
jgi:hypothetical protein